MLRILLLLLLLSGCQSVKSCPLCQPCAAAPQSCIEIGKDHIKLTTAPDKERVQGYVIIHNICMIPQRDVSVDALFNFNGQIVFVQKLGTVSFMEPNRFEQINFDFFTPSFKSDDVKLTYETVSHQ